MSHNSKIHFLDSDMNESSSKMKKQGQEARDNSGNRYNILGRSNSDHLLIERDRHDKSDVPQNDVDST